MSDLYIVFTIKDPSLPALHSKLTGNWGGNDHQVLVIGESGPTLPANAAAVADIGAFSVVVACDTRASIHERFRGEGHGAERVNVVLHKEQIGATSNQSTCYASICTSCQDKVIRVSKEHHTLGNTTANALENYCKKLDAGDDAREAYEQLLKDLATQDNRFRNILLNPAIAVLQHFENFQRGGKGVNDIASSTGELLKHWEALAAWELPTDNDETFRTALLGKIKELMQ